MTTSEEWKEVLKGLMSEQRFEHSCNVADMSRELAEKNNTDCDTAYLAGLVHDIAKEIPKEKMLMCVLKSDLSVSKAELDTPKLWHPIAGSYILEHEYGISDKDFLNAVRYHTVARAGMSTLEEIIYVADFVSAERKMKCVPEVREIARKNLDSGVLEELKYSIKATIEKQGFIPQSTIEAYNYYTRKCSGNIKNSDVYSYFIKENNCDREKKSEK